MKPTKLLFALCFLVSLFARSQTFQRMHIPAGSYAIEALGARIPANCIDPDLPSPGANNFYKGAIGNINVVRMRGGVRQVLPFAQAVAQWVAVTGPRSSLDLADEGRHFLDDLDQLEIRPRNPNDGYRYRLEVGKGGSVVGEHSTVLPGVNRQIIDPAIFDPLDALDTRIRGSGDPDLYSAFRNERKDLVDRAPRNSGFAASVRELIDRYTRFESALQDLKVRADAAFPQSTFVKNALLREGRNRIIAEWYEPLEGSLTERLNAVFHLNLAESSAGFATDYLSVYNGGVLNQSQIDFIGQEIGLALPAYKDVFRDVRLLDRRAKEVRSVNGTIKYNRYNDLSGHLSSQNLVVLAESYISESESLIPFLKSKSIHVVLRSEFFQDASHLAVKKTKIFIHYSSDPAKTKAIWGNQDEVEIARIVNANIPAGAGAEGMQTFQDIAELEPMLDAARSRGERAIVITDQNPSNSDVFLMARRYNAMPFACETYRLPEVDAVTSRYLYAEPLVGAARKLQNKELSGFEMTRQVETEYTEEAKKQNRNFIANCVLVAGAFFEAVFILHHFFGYEPTIQKQTNQQI